MSALDSAGAPTVRNNCEGAMSREQGSQMTWHGARKRCGLSKFCGQATKGAWWMPWQKQAKKVVASCDKPRGAASRH